LTKEEDLKKIDENEYVDCSLIKRLNLLLFCIQMDLRVIDVFFHYSMNERWAFSKLGKEDQLAPLFTLAHFCYLK